MLIFKRPTQINGISKYQTLIIILAIILGLLLGNFTAISYYAHYLIIPSLTLMLFGIFLTISIADILKSFSNKKFFSTSIMINFIWTPLFAYFLGYLFFKNETALWIGFIMLMVTPCTDWYLIFTEIAKGNTSLSASILPINLILQILLLPLYLYLFFGKNGFVNFGILFDSIIFILLVPFLLAQAIRFFFGKSDKNKNIRKKLFSFFEVGQIVFLGLAILAMFASQGKYLINNFSITVTLLSPLLIFFIITFFIGVIISRLLRFSYADSVSLDLTILARNSPISLAIAIVAFPNEPLIGIALVIAPLIEIPVLGVVSQVLLHIKPKD